MTLKSFKKPIHEKEEDNQRANEMVNQRLNFFCMKNILSCPLSAITQFACTYMTVIIIGIWPTINTAFKFCFVSILCTVWNSAAWFYRLCVKCIFPLFKLFSFYKLCKLFHKMLSTHPSLWHRNLLTAVLGDVSVPCHQQLCENEYRTYRLWHQSDL